MSALIVVCPLPPLELSPNRTRNVHHFAKAGAVADYRQLCAVLARNAALSAAWETPARARVSLLWGLKGARGDGYAPRDADNSVAAFKAGIDGLCDAEIIESDRWANLELGSVRCDKSAGPFVRVTVEALP